MLRSTLFLFALLSLPPGGLFHALRTPGHNRPRKLIQGLSQRTQFTHTARLKAAL